MHGNWLLAARVGILLGAWEKYTNYFVLGGSFRGYSVFLHIAWGDTSLINVDIF